MEYSTNYRFEDGIFAPTDHPIAEVKGDHDLESALKKLGFSEAEKYGDPESPYIQELWTKDDEFLAILCTDMDKFWTVRTKGLQDYLTFVRDYLMPLVVLQKNSADT